MRAEDFIAKLEAASPKHAPRGQYVSQSHIDDNLNLNNYDCQKRGSPLQISAITGSEDLIELFNDWETSTIIIEEFELLERPVKKPEGLEIGSYLLYPL